MKFYNKLTGLLLAAIMMALTIATTESATAVPYVVCNNTGVPMTVTVFANCGGGAFIVLPANPVIPPGGCFTWNVPPPPCFVPGIRVNGVFYLTPTTFPFCYTVATPPPNTVCFTGGIPQVNLF